MAPERDLQQAAVRFEQSYEPWLRVLFGCKPDPATPIDKEHCNPSLGRVDYAGWKKAREAAKEMFQLQDK